MSLVAYGAFEATVVAVVWLEASVAQAEHICLDCSGYRVGKATTATSWVAVLVVVEGTEDATGFRLCSFQYCFESTIIGLELKLQNFCHAIDPLLQHHSQLVDRLLQGLQGVSQWLDVHRKVDFVQHDEEGG